MRSLPAHPASPRPRRSPLRRLRPADRSPQRPPRPADRSPLRPRFASALLTVSAVLGTALITLTGAPAHADVIGVGEGSYTTDRPAGAKGPSNSDGVAVTPKVTSRVTGPVPTNDWWSSLIWQRYAGNPYSENLYAHPLAFHAYADGLGMSYSDTASITPDGRTYEHIYSEDLRVGLDGLNSPDTKVDGWSDWTVSPYWSDGTRTLRATIGHGLPYAYFTGTGAAARVTFAGTPNVWHHSGGVLGVTVRGHHYALFAPSAASWSVSGTVARSTLAGRDYFSVALLPSTGALALFQKYAYAFVTDTRAGWSYDSATARVTSTFTATTATKEGSQTGTLLALYRHQWRASSDPVTAHRYASPRGEMRLREGASFRTTATFNGVLPSLADLGGYDTNRLSSYLDAVLAEPDLLKGATDTYWTGKALGRLAMLVPIADQLGRTAARDRLLDAIRGRLADWLTASSGETERLFAYDATWDTLIGYPASYGADTELNDHHFHYGYFVLAAAVLARYDPGWVSSSRYGGMVELLVKDAANWSRSDSRFPFLRHFDPYAGHSWASGHAGFAHGNNQESSSEAMMFATGMILFAEATGNTGMRDAGIYLYTTERAAIGDYWFDAANAVFPSTYDHDTLGILWGAGGAYATWWTANPEEIHGINMLPITGGSLYHGAWQADVRANVAEMRANNGGAETEWRDVIWEFLALGDPAAAKSAWDGSGGNYEPEWGETKAHTYHWIYNLAATGTPDHSVTADIPTYAVFAKDGVRTYLAYNSGGSTRTVWFSDGSSLSVPPRSLASRTGSGSDPGDANLALGRPVQTSSVETAGLDGPNAVDGSTTTRWSSQFSDPQWIAVDLGTSTAIGRVVLKWEAAYGRSYRIEVSGDGQSWQQVYATSSGDGGTDDIAVDASGRYVRMYGTQRGTEWGYSLWEFEVYADGGGSTPPPGFSPTLYVIDGAATGGSSTLSTSPGSGAATDTMDSAGGANYDGTPHNPLVYLISGVSAAYDSARATGFSMYVDAGTAVGNGQQVRVSYDLTGDGTWDRVETYQYFATDDLAGWERYIQARGLKSASGTFGDLRNGRVRLEVWNAIGGAPSQLRTSATSADGSQSVVVIPYN